MRFVEISGGRAAVVEGPEPEPGEGWALVRMLACGICGTDVHLLHGMTLPSGVNYPLRPGHEVAGIVESAPPGGHVEAGQLVVLHPIGSCGRCEACRRGEDRLCPSGRMLGIHDPGGLAELVAWPVARMRPADGLEPSSAAVLADAVATAYRAVAVADVPSGATVCVLGAGGVGTHVLQLLEAIGPASRRLAVVRSEGTAARVEAIGAEVVRGGLDGAARRVKDAAGPCDVVVDFTGSAAAPIEAVHMLRRGGRLVIGSVVDENLDLGPSNAFVTRGLEVRSAYASNISDLEAVIELARTGVIDMDAAVSATRPLSDAPAALREVAQRPPGLVRMVVLGD